jgi:hypothetical protein
VAGHTSEAGVVELSPAVIVRLDRTIQYAAAFRLYRWRLRLLVAPPSRGMTTGIIRKAGSDPGLFSFVIPGRAKREPQVCNCTSGNLEIPGLVLRTIPE